MKGSSETNVRDCSVRLRNGRATDQTDDVEQETEMGSRRARKSPDRIPESRGRGIRTFLELDSWLGPDRHHGALERGNLGEEG